MALLNMQRQSIRWLIAEFVVVVLGVGVALAADSWREDLKDRSLESDYLNRIYEDLTIGLTDLEYQLEDTRITYEAVNRLIDILESGPGPSMENEIINQFILAARIGATPDQLVHDTTYQELVSTGRLNSIRNQSIRFDLYAYYRMIENLSFLRQAYPRTLLYRFTELTGMSAYQAESWEDIKPIYRTRLVEEIVGNTEFLKELFRLRIGLASLIEGVQTENGRYGRQIRLNTELRARLAR